MFLNKITSPFGYIPYIAGILISFFLVYFYPLNRLKKQYKKSEKMRVIIKWNIDNEKMEICTENIAEQFTWNEFHKYYNGKNHLFFQLKEPRNQYKIIPKRVFSNDQLEGLIKVLKEKTKNCYFPRNKGN
jgi:hypothetical protein